MIWVSYPYAFLMLKSDLRGIETNHRQSYLKPRDALKSDLRGIETRTDNVLKSLSFQVKIRP